MIEIYQANGFATLALEAKKDYVSRYGIDSEFRKANPDGWERARPLVKTHLTELARHHHALAQKSKASADYQEAVHWYRAYIGSFPDDPDTAQNNFLLAELLFEDKQLFDAATEYEKVAYGYPAHAKSADAGYSALLSYAGLEKAAAANELPALQRTSVDSALRFARPSRPTRAQARCSPTRPRSCSRCATASAPPKWRRWCSSSTRRPHPSSVAWPGP